MFMYEYAHGADIYDENGAAAENIIDFSANINPLGPPEAALAAARAAIGGAAHIYPDSGCRLLSAKIGAFENTDKSNIFCSNGASDILFRLVYAVKPKKILVTAPSFADYERAGAAAGAEVIYYALQKENNFITGKDIADFITAAAPDIVFICNPNNPTGGLTDYKTIKKIAAACFCAGAILLIDECFMDFVCGAHKYSAKPLVRRYKNIVILKAFTKIFALPGLRLGYAICGDANLINAMKFCGPDWAVSGAAQAAGLAALENAAEYIERTRAYIKQERAYMTKSLRGMGLKVYPAAANFIFFYCPFDLFDLNLNIYNIKIRSCADFKGLTQNYYRAAVLSGEKNRLFIEGVRAIWQNRL